MKSALQATLCLLDARPFSQPRYRENENFRDQLAAANFILAGKSGTYQPEDLQALKSLIAQDSLQMPCYRIEQARANAALSHQSYSLTDCASAS